MNTSLRDKVALVTGGTSGIAEAVALRLAKAGTKVVKRTDGIKPARNLR